MVEFCQGDENSTSSNLTRLPAFWIIVSISLSSNGWERYSCNVWKIGTCNVSFFCFQGWYSIKRQTNCKKLGLVILSFLVVFRVGTRSKGKLTRLSLAISRLRLQPSLKQQVTSPRMIEVDQFSSDGFLLNNFRNFQHFSPILNLFSPIPSLKVLAIPFRSSL